MFLLDVILDSFAITHSDGTLYPTLYPSFYSLNQNTNFNTTASTMFAPVIVIYANFSPA